MNLPTIIVGDGTARMIDLSKVETCILGKEGQETIYARTSKDEPFRVMRKHEMVWLLRAYLHLIRFNGMFNIETPSS